MGVKINVTVPYHFTTTGIMNFETVYQALIYIITTQEINQNIQQTNALYKNNSVMSVNQSSNKVDNQTIAIIFYKNTGTIAQKYPNIEQV